MKKNKFLTELPIILGLIIGLSTLVYHRSLFLFFVQDDFYLLSISQAKNIDQFFRLFLPHPDTAWYRPLSQQVFFWLAQQIFDLNPLPFHLVIFLTHGVNSLLLFMLLRRFCKSFLISTVAMLFYALNISHFLSLSWPAAYGFLLGPTGFIASLILFNSFLRSGRCRDYWLTLIAFLFSLMIIEVNMVLLPIFALPWLLDRQAGKKFNLPIAVMVFLPMLVVVLVIVFLRFIIIPAKVGGAYRFTLTYFFTTLRFYLWRLLGLAQSIRLVDFYLSLGHVLAVLVLSLLAFFIPLLAGIREIYQLHAAWQTHPPSRNSLGNLEGFLTVAAKNMLTKAPIIFLRQGVIIAFLALSPFLLLPFHLSPHYLGFSLVGMSLIMAVLLDNFFQLLRPKIKFIYLFILTLAIILAAVSGEKMEWQTHWIVRRANLAKSLIERKIYTAPVGSEEYFALGANTALQIFGK